MASTLARTLFAILLLCLSTFWAEVTSAEEPLDNKTWIENAWKNFNPGSSVAEQTKASSFVKTADYLLLNDHYAYVVGVIDGFFFGNAEAENGFPNVMEGCLDKLNPGLITPVLNSAVEDPFEVGDNPQKTSVAEILQVILLEESRRHCEQTRQSGIHSMGRPPYFMSVATFLEAPSETRATFSTGLLDGYLLGHHMGAEGEANPFTASCMDSVTIHQIVALFDLDAKAASGEQPASSSFYSVMSNLCGS